MADAVRLHQRKIEIGALAPRLRVDVAHQRCQLLQCGVHPRVDLQLVGGHVAVLVVDDGVMAPGGAEYAQQQRAGLCEGVGEYMLICERGAVKTKWPNTHPLAVDGLGLRLLVIVLHDDH